MDARRIVATESRACVFYSATRGEGLVKRMPLNRKCMARFHPAPEPDILDPEAARLYVVSCARKAHMPQGRMLTSHVCSA
jgi:hypothetical protein